MSKTADTDMVNSPPHYKSTGSLECIHYTRCMHFSIGNAFKYIYRNGTKPGTNRLEDFKKARFYIEDFAKNKPYRDQKYVTGALMLSNHSNAKILRLIILISNCTLAYTSEYVDRTLLELNKEIVAMESHHVKT